jgi:tetratricopeptide (TPR) repeat protein
MRIARRFAAVLLLLTAAGCARPPLKPVAAPAAPPPPTPAQRLASAEALVREGCLDCLIDAFGQYELLRAMPSAAGIGTAGAVRSAALIALRQRELGMTEEGYSQRARSLLLGSPDQPAWLRTVLDIVDVLPAGGVTRTPTNDLDLDRSRALRLNHDAWRETLRGLAPASEFNAYVWLSFACANEARDVTRDTIFAPTAAFKDVPLIAYRRATCRSLGPETMQELIARNPRFIETKYYLGSYDVSLLITGQDKLDEADRLFDEAYAWRPEWPALTQSIANIAMTVEEFERAALFYDRTLLLEAHAVDALLGKARAQTYLGRAVEAIATLDVLLLERWFVGDARYWRALNESELERNDEAWADVELAAKLLVNAEVPKLAGLIAYRRHELDVSRARFEQSRSRNPKDCETGYYLGVVLAEQRAWPRTVDVLRQTADCLQGNELAYTQEIASIRASHDPPERQAKKIARREQYIAKGRRYLATSWFDIAVAYFNLSKPAEARQYAEKVVEDEQFGDRAKEILARLQKSP